MSTQIRNAGLVSLLETDFIKRNEPGNLLGNIISTYQALPGLRGFWPMSSVDENGDVYDLAMQGRTLTNTNTVTFSNTNFLPFAEFNASTNYLTRADEAGLDITGNLTFGCWARFNATGSFEALFNKYLSTGNQRSYTIFKNSSDLAVCSISVDGTAVTTLTSTSTFAQDTWGFIVGKFTVLTSLDVWLNDEKSTNTTSIPASIFNSTAPFRIGESSGGYTNGDVALAFLCAYALPDNMITNLYQLTRILFENQ